MGSLKRIKRLAVEQLLEHEDYFLIVVDPTRPGVVLPEHLVVARQPVGLHIGRGLALPIPDLELDDDGLRGTLSFDRSPCHCTVPWPSLVQVSVDGEHLIWLSRDDGEHAPPPSPPRRDRPKLRVLK